VPGTKLAAAAASATASGKPRDRALALMDLGALVCTARSPSCTGCPLRPECAWNAAGRPPSERRAVTTPRFETTARWARGRIVDMLRERPHSERAFAEAMPPAHAARLAGYLAALRDDGLIEASGAMWRLAGDQAMNIASPKL
jgi:A/G-specific adenine glycosylase